MAVGFKPLAVLCEGKMNISDRFRCFYSAKLTERDGSYVLEVPREEIANGNVDTDRTYRVALLSVTETDESDSDVAEVTAKYDPNEHRAETLDPPVSEGDVREVEIESIGDQGDGIARVERGFVVVVPDTQLGERVTIEITGVRENVAFAEVRERQSHV
jgi:predicted RNA-binding protein with TRAM domain